MCDCVKISDFYWCWRTIASTSGNRQYPVNALHCCAGAALRGTRYAIRVWAGLDFSPDLYTQHIIIRSTQDTEGAVWIFGTAGRISLPLRYRVLDSVCHPWSYYTPRGQQDVDVNLEDLRAQAFASMPASYTRSTMLILTRAQQSRTIIAIAGVEVGTWKRDRSLFAKSTNTIRMHNDKFNGRLPG